MIPVWWLFVALPVGMGAAFAFGFATAVWTLWKMQPAEALAEEPLREGWRMKSQQAGDPGR